MIVHFHFIFILDLPKLHTISFNDDFALAGDDLDNRETTITKLDGLKRIEIG